MELVTHRRNLHKIPEPGFAEEKTTQYLLNAINKLDGWKVDQPLETGLLAYKTGTSNSKCIAFRADIDALSMIEETELAFSSQHKGFMHACGHDMHMAILLGLANHLQNNPCQENVLLIFQPAEEGPGGALPLLATGVLDKYRVDEIYALHVSPSFPTGTVASRSGALFANTSELFIDLFGLGGHAAMPHLANDMVLAGSNLAIQLHSIVSRNIDPNNQAVITLGELKAGTRQNIIASKAHLSGTIRAINMNDMAHIKNRIKQLLKGIEEGFQVTTKLDYGANYKAVVNSDRIVKRFKERVSSLPSIKYLDSPPTMTGEDFGYFLDKLPGMLFWLGVQKSGQKNYGLHNSRFSPNEEALEVGLQSFAAMLNY